MSVVDKKKSSKPKTQKRTQKKKTISQKSNEETNSETIFFLENINPEEILLSYYGKFLEDKDEFGETIVNFDSEDMLISDILHEKSKKSKRSIMFLDPHKGQVKYWGIMIDMTVNGPLPRYTTKPCWHCRNKFSSHPIGCPVKYYPHKKEGLQKERVEQKFSELNLTLEDGNDFFETEGIFCTFPCVKSYIIEQISKTRSPKYKKALTLLTLLYKKIFGVVSTIPTAGTWKLTIDWGGHLTPQEFRASTGLLEYSETVNVRRPYMFCSSTWVREKRL